jgi:II/X family phage/plasmid replication protein
MMVDYLTIEIPADLPRVICGGTIFKVGDDGAMEWNVLTRKEMEGSWSTKCQVRAIDRTKLEISGNVAKFMQGHNLYGPDDPIGLVRAFLDRVQPILWPEGMPPIDLEAATVARIDVTSGFLLPCQNDVLLWLRGAHEAATRPYLGRGVFKGTDGSTLVYGDATGKRAKAWQLTFYAKGMEVLKHPLPPLMGQRKDVIDWVARLLRCEVRLRTQEVKRLGLRTLGEWTAEVVARVWQEKVGMLDFMEEKMNPSGEYEGVKSRLVDAFHSWEAGKDLRVNRSRAAWYKLRKDIRATFGVDISLTKPKSNVVPLRRIIVAEPAHRPSWADDVERMLAA